MDIWQSKPTSIVLLSSKKRGRGWHSSHTVRALPTLEQGPQPCCALQLPKESSQFLMTRSWNWCAMGPGHWYLWKFPRGFHRAAWVENHSSRAVLVNSVAASHIPTCDYFTFDLLKSNKIKNPFPGHTSHIQGLVASGFSVGEWRYRTFPSPQNVVFDGTVLECEVSRVKTPVFLPTLEDCFFQMSHPLPSYKPHSKVQLSGPPLPRGPLCFQECEQFWLTGQELSIHLSPHCKLVVQRLPHLPQVTPQANGRVRTLNQVGFYQNSSSLTYSAQPLHPWDN